MAIGRRERGPGLDRMASAAVLWPIGGLIVGLAVGAARAQAAYGGGIDGLECVVKWGVTGFFAGLMVVVLLAIRTRPGDPVTIRRLMAMVAVAAVLSWFVARVFFGAIGFEGF